MKIYLDACCLNRPFDDRSNHRVRLESEAVIAIIERCLVKQWELVGSEVVDFEISLTPDDDRRERVSVLSSIAKFKVVVDKEVKSRAAELHDLGIAAFDALHVACAEKGRADVLLTTDDEFLRKIERKNIVAKVKTSNPLKWFMEVIQNEKSSIDT